MQFARPEDLGFAGQRLARINMKMQTYVDEQKLAELSFEIAN